LFDGTEKEYLTACIDSGCFSSEGPFVARLEEESLHIVSAALDVAVAALKLGPGTKVILPPFTIISCGPKMPSLVIAGTVEIAAIL
jgi:perosamine synthetase